MKLQAAGGRELSFRDGPLVMGILNVTPDSFSDGGRMDPSQALKHALKMAADGAAILDIGGESTRPGFETVPVEEELRRVLPVLRELRRELPEIFISVDTRKAAVAKAALDLGADIINDVSALEYQPTEMCQLLAQSGAACILMHSQPLHTQGRCLAEVSEYLGKRLQWACRQTGLSREHFALDAGIGFGKSVEQNVELMMASNALRQIGAPVLLGFSRKSVLGALTGKPVNEREEATLAAHAIVAFTGVDILRVHDVAACMTAITIAKALRQYGLPRD